MPPKRTSTSETPVITLDAIGQTILMMGISAALKEQAYIQWQIRIPIGTLKPKKFLKCAEEDRVTFATGTLTDDALSWWNAHAQPMGIEQANQITWTELKRLLTNKYCPRTEIKKMEDEFYESNKLMEAFIGGLPQSIEGNVTASKPQTLEEAINISQRLMDQIIKRDSVQETNDHKQKLEDKGNIINNNNYQNNYNNNNRNDEFITDAE
ncbi:hypothetical protein Tco_0367961 [Tanacetum coccineum]